MRREAPRGRVVRPSRARPKLRSVPAASSRPPGRRNESRDGRTRKAAPLRRLGRALRSLCILALACGSLGAGSWAAWRAYEDNGFLALQEVSVTGNRLWDRAALIEKAGVDLGVKLPSMRVSAIESSLRSLPGLADVEVRRILPSRLEIRVSEMEPVAMGFDKGWRGLAPDGSELPGLDPEGSEVPIIERLGALRAEERKGLAGFLESARKAHPELYRGFSRIALKGGEASIEVRGRRKKLLFDLSNKSLNSLEILQALISRHEVAWEKPGTVDLRVEGYAYVR